jgi:hypothetical protein
MNRNKQKKLLSKWVNVTQLIEGKDKNTYLVLKPTNELPDVTPMNKPIELDYSIYPKTIDEDTLGCSYPDCICQGNEITDCKNRTPDQVVFGDKTALVEDVFHQGHKKLSFRERCGAGNYTPFNIENLMGELSKKKKEPYITQEEFEEFHHTIMDGLKIPRYGK